MVCVADAKIFSLYKFHLNFLVFSMLLSGEGTSLLNMLLEDSRQLVWFTAYVFGALSIPLCLGWILWKTQWQVFRLKVVLSLFLLFTATHISYGFADAYKRLRVLQLADYMQWPYFFNLSPKAYQTGPSNFPKSSTPLTSVKPAPSNTLESPCNASKKLTSPTSLLFYWILFATIC